VGRVRQARPAARFGGTPLDPVADFPRLGEDSATVLASLGYDAAAVDDLVARGIVTRASARPADGHGS
jgi:crotonobetainyl-CoA:carnitine CoA-transferase CaiB-like acyl-CoA transferase